MSAFLLLSVQSTLSIVACALIARWYIAPRLASRPRDEAVMRLLWIHVFRYTPLTLLVPGQVDSRVPIRAAETIAYGDLVSGIAALIAVVALRQRLPVALSLVWVFSSLGTADLIIGTLVGVRAQLYSYPLGWNWYILTFYVPMLIVSQVMIFHRLLRGPGPLQATPQR